LRRGERENVEELIRNKETPRETGQKNIGEDPFL